MWSKLVIAVAACCLAATAYAGTVTAKVSIASQSVNVYVDGALAHTWPVSTGKRGFETPHGSYSPYWLSKNHRSRAYNNAPMPYAVFFLNGYAVHGTTAVKRLGQPASHGCVRLLTENARVFYELVEKHGKKNVRVTIVE